MQNSERLFGGFHHIENYDKAEDAMFSLMYMAYKEGWLAAGGELPESQNDF